MNIMEKKPLTPEERILKIQRMRLLAKRVPELKVKLEALEQLNESRREELLLNENDDLKSRDFDYVDIIADIVKQVVATGINLDEAITTVINEFQDLSTEIITSDDVKNRMIIKSMRVTKNDNEDLVDVTEKVKVNKVKEWYLNSKEDVDNLLYLLLPLSTLMLFRFLGGMVYESDFELNPLLLPGFVLFQPILALGLKYWFKNSENNHGLLNPMYWFNLWVASALFSFFIYQKVEIFLNQKIDTEIPIKNMVSVLYFFVFISIYFTWIILRKPRKLEETEKDEIYFRSYYKENEELVFRAKFDLIQKVVAAFLIFLLIFPLPNWCLGTARVIIIVILIQQFREGFFNKQDYFNRHIIQQIASVGLFALYIGGFYLENFTLQIINGNVCLFLLIISFIDYKKIIKHYPN